MPMHSAMSALATKNPVNPINSFAGLSFSIWLIMQYKEKIKLSNKENNIGV
jgi:hypothetical protein